MQQDALQSCVELLEDTVVELEAENKSYTSMLAKIEADMDEQQARDCFFRTPESCATFGDDSARKQLHQALFRAPVWVYHCPLTLACPKRPNADQFEWFVSHPNA